MDEPIVKVCFAVVDNVPVAVTYNPPAAPAETDAAGVPEFIFNTANFADAVAVPPTNKSSVEFIGYNVPLLELQKLVLAEHAVHVGAPLPPEVKHSPVVPTELNAYAVPLE